MERVRVLEIISGFAVEGPLGGIERFGTELARALDASRFEPIVCGLWRYHTPYEEGHADELCQEGIHAFFAADWDEARPYLSFARAWRGIVQHLAGQKVDLIHSHCQFGDMAALLTARTLRARALLRTVHNEREWPRRPLRRLLLTNLIYPWRFRLEVGVSRQVVDNLDARPVARFLHRESRYLCNAIDLDRFRVASGSGARERKRRELGLPLDGAVIGTVGRLTRQKGYSVLLDAASLVLAVRPGARFIIVGGGELDSELRGLASELGIAHAVCFCGPRADVEGLLAAMDLFVSSSLWEGLPTVILESMAAQVPVVATDVSGTRELVQDGVTGLLVPPGDSRALAEALLHALDDPEHAHLRAARALDRAQAFSIGQVAEGHRQAYLGLLASH